MRIPSFRQAAAAALLAGTALLSGCATPTAYQPATGYGRSANGYSDQQVDRDRFQVSFSGNSLTSRDTVERYLLYRSAQLTVERGYDHFILVDRNTEKHTQTYADRPFGGGLYGGWGPSWRFYGRGYGFRGGIGWGGYDPFYGDPFFWNRGFDVTTVERYEANAEIVVGRGPKPMGNYRAFDARSVLDTLGPTIQLPEEQRRARRY